MQQQLTEAGPWLCGAVLQRPVAWPVLRRRLTLVYWQWLLPALPNCAAYCQLLWQLRVCGGELVPPSQLLCCCSATHFGCYPKPLPKMAGGELFCFLRPLQETGWSCIQMQKQTQEARTCWLTDDHQLRLIVQLRTFAGGCLRLAIELLHCLQHTAMERSLYPPTNTRITVSAKESTNTVRSCSAAVPISAISSQSQASESSCRRKSARVHSDSI